MGPGRTDSQWVEVALLPGEFALWTRMSASDRRHSLAVARRVEAALTAAPRPVLAAALLHDVGKLDSRLGTYGRVVATLAGKMAGPAMADAWSETRGFTRRIGLYLRHSELGADRLRLAGSDPLTVAWAAEHHRSPEYWSLPPELATVLKEADDD
jgi:hypothetical protein